MKDNFEQVLYPEINYRENNKKRNVIKSADAKIQEAVSITVEEESVEGVKIILKKDKDENIKEIKFVCSCGQTKSIILDYNEE
jgi:hypothetical protein